MIAHLGDREGEVRHVIIDADSKVGLRMSGHEVVVHSDDLTRCKVLASEAVASTDHLNVAISGLEQFRYMLFLEV